MRLGPARMTHVMRWLGAATRAHETALDYVTSRRVFGASLSNASEIMSCWPPEGELVK